MATADVGAGLKWKVSVRRRYLGGQLNERWLIDVEKCPKR